MIDLFVFHIPDEQKTDQRFALMELMIASARKVCRVGKVHLFTWKRSNVPGCLSIDTLTEIKPTGTSRKDIQLVRAHAINQFLYSELFNTNTISVEYDQLFQKSPEDSFNMEFDVGLTYACSSRPGGINGGVAFWKNCQETRNYYDKYLKQFLLTKDQPDLRFTANGTKPPPPRREWGGDECVHVDLLPEGSLENHRQKIQKFIVGNTSVWLLPADIYNCQLGWQKDGNIHLPFLEQTKIRHFHSWKKNYMFQYARRHLNIESKEVIKKFRLAVSSI